MKEKIKKFIKKIKPLDLIIWPFIICLIGYVIYLSPEILAYFIIAGALSYIIERIK